MPIFETINSVTYRCDNRNAGVVTTVGTTPTQRNWQPLATTTELVTFLADFCCPVDVRIMC